MRYTSKIPQLVKVRQSDAGLDIFASDDCLILSKSRATIRTSLCVEIPFGYAGLIWSRSGLAVNYGIEVGAGCIDSEYRGEVLVLLYNHGDTDYLVKKGDRVAQLLTIPIALGEYAKVESLSDTDRGESGFGSSGL